ncbi:MAG: acetate--CoA ligase family protein [Archaeoglobaceae archaeon]|nr:acetate--CoA ligase family protein [Archaeoglobaceae archaeon]MDW7989854.1 acetate--CoA ligase family protein [Archaeoglobaceae archaeon]
MEHESKALLESYGIRTASCVFVKNEKELLDALKLVGFPAVLKVASRRIVHKSEVGGVRFVKSEEEALKNFRDLISIEFVEGINVQPMLERGLEIFIGIAEDVQFGSFLAIGLGGFFLEALKDYSIRLVPVSRKDVESMLEELISKDIFDYRGKRFDKKAIIELALKVSEIVEKENILEMDLNPVFVYENGYAVADARIVIGKRRNFERKTKSPIFNPKKVAVIGASNNPIKVGYAILQSLKTNRSIEIYPVNPALYEIDGFKVFKSLKELPEIDLAIIALPAEKVVETVENLIGKAKEVLIVSAGFKEAEVEEGKEREKKLMEMSEKIRIIGPNVFGFVNVLQRINASFTPEFNKLKPGKIALVSQSGGICHYVLHKFNDVGFSYIIHLGNRCDIDFPDVFEFLSKDEKTRVVTVYVEGLENGRAFFEELKKITSSGKFAVVMKAGRSRVADKASLSHTGSIAGDYKIFTSALKQAGAIVAESPTELIDIAILLEKFGRVRNVAIVTIQAGLGIVFADLLEKNGGKIIELSDKTIEELKKILPPLTLRENPLDLSFSGLEIPKLKKILELLKNDKKVDVVVFCYAVAPPSWVIPEEVMNELFKDEIVVYISEKEDFEKKKKKLNCILFDSIERASLALARLSHSFN